MIANCKLIECPLYPLRPNQELKGYSEEDTNPEYIQDEISKNIELGSIANFFRK